MPRVSAPPDPIRLRRLVLAVAVLHDTDVEAADDGVVLPGHPPVRVGWSELRRSLGASDPDGAGARRLVARHLRGRRLLADVPAELLAEQARPVGWPVDAPDHPGLDWICRRVGGGVLDLGLGFVGLGAPGAVEVIPGPCLTAAGVDPRPWWPAAAGYLERVGVVAAERLDLPPPGVLRLGDCDVVTLVGARSLRQELVARAGSGLAAVVVPMRRRGWIDVRRIDPAFAPAAAAITEEPERGFDSALLITVDEVSRPTRSPAGSLPIPIS